MTNETQSPRDARWAGNTRRSRHASRTRRANRDARSICEGNIGKSSVPTGGTRHSIRNSRRTSSYQVTTEQQLKAAQARIAELERLAGLTLLTPPKDDSHGPGTARDITEQRLGYASSVIGIIVGLSLLPQSFRLFDKEV